MIEHFFRRHPFFWLWLALTAGIACATQFRPASPGVVAAVSCGLLAAFLGMLAVLRTARWWILIAVMAFAFAGVSRTMLRAILPASASLPRGPVYIEGLVSQDDGAKTVIHASCIGTGARYLPYRHTVMILRRDATPLSIGDRVRFFGTLRDVRRIRFSSFPYGDILYKRGIDHLLYARRTPGFPVLRAQEGYVLLRWSRLLRDAAVSRIRSLFPPSYADQLAALMLGERSRFPEPLMADFRKTGTAHIIAISGFNVGIVAGILFLLCTALRMPLALRYACIIAALAAFCPLTGMSVSVGRATLLACIFYAGLLAGRDSDFLNSLGLAGIIILLINPMETFAPGYILSFGAVLSLSVYDTIVRRPLTQRPSALRRLVRSTAYVMGASAAAWIGLIPVIAHYFGMVTPGGIIANVFIIPLSAVIITGGTAVVGISLVSPVAAGYAAQSVAALMALNNALVHLFAQMPGMYFTVGSFPVWIDALYYCLLGLGCWTLTAHSRSTENKQLTENHQR